MTTPLSGCNDRQEEEEEEDVPLSNSSFAQEKRRILESVAFYRRQQQSGQIEQQPQQRSRLAGAIARLSSSTRLSVSSRRSLLQDDTILDEENQQRRPNQQQQQQQQRSAVSRNDGLMSTTSSSRQSWSSRNRRARHYSSRKDGLLVVDNNDDDDDEDMPQPGAYFSGPRRGTQVPVAPFAPQSLMSSPSLNSRHTPEQLNLYAQVELASPSSDKSSLHDEPQEGDGFPVWRGRNSKFLCVALLTLFLVMAILGGGLAVGLAPKKQTSSPQQQQQQTGNNSDGLEEQACSMFVQDFLMACVHHEVVYEIPSCVNDQLDELRSTLVPRLFPGGMFATTCHPAGQALIVLAAAKHDNPDMMLEADFYLLTTLFVATHGWDWILQRDWLSPVISPCYWHGVRCAVNGGVVGLDLDSNRLGGSIPSEIGLLTGLSK